jgi:succinyl-diaminopimelate desuccinylase
MNDARPSPTLALTQELIALASVTPDDAGCQDLLVERLAPLGFTAEWMNSGPVRNLWLRRGDQAPLFVFAGHTDVVPTGPAQQWASPPFVPTLRDGMLYGRGAADMKGSIAAFVSAVDAFLATTTEPQGSIALLITSDEEGPSLEGTVHVVKVLDERGEHIDWCIVGEPSSSTRLGDVVRVGRRGSLNATLRIDGIQGHVAYPQDALNPIHVFTRVANALQSEVWDEGNEFFPATSFQISNVHAGTGADNVIPGALEARLNFRYCTENTQESLQQRVEAILQAHQARYHLEWSLSGGPFLTQPGALVNAVSQAVSELCDVTPELNTGGGTSDGRFIAPTGAQVVELGPINATIHKIDECVDPADLDTLARVYQQVLHTLL